MACESPCVYICSLCGATAKNSSAKFCTKCGQKLVVKCVPQVQKCVICHKELEPGEAFCGECGTRSDATNSKKDQTPGGNVTGRNPQDLAEQGELYTNDLEKEKSEPGKSLETVAINVSGAKCIAVTFIVLVPHKIWGWEKNKTILRICFEHKDLGNWKGTTTEFRTTRDIEAGYLMMEGTVSLPLSITEGSRAVPYKYAVCEYQNPYVESCYEYLYNSPESDKETVSRCLIIPTAYSHGHYHQFDTMVYPRLKQKTWKQRAWEFIKTDFPDYHVVQRDCLKFYLATHYNILSRCSIIHDFNIKNFCDEALQIFVCLYQQRTYKDMTVFVWTDEELKQDYLQSWLLPIMHDLNQYEVKSVDQNALRLVAAVTLACCIQNLVSLDLIKLHEIGSEKLDNMLCFFHLLPATHSKQCKEYEFLERIVPEDFRGNVAGAICALSKHAAHMKGFDPLSWLCAMPLVHFLRKQSNPFGVMSINPERIDFRDPNLHLQLSGETAVNKGTLKVVESSLNKMKPFFELDPLLLPLFVSICPISELELLIDHIPLSLFTLWIHRRFVEEIECINRSEADEIVMRLLCIKSKLGTTTDSMPDMLASMLFFLLKLKGKKYANNAMAQCFKICGIVISLILHSASVWYEDKANMEGHEMIDEFCSKLKQYTKEWVDRVCDDALFGEHSRMEWDESKAKTELEVWESLCDIDIPQKLQSTWQNIVVYIVRERIMKVYITNISKLLYLLGLRKSTPAYVSDTVSSLVIERMEMMDEQAVCAAISALNMAKENTGTADYICSVFNSLLQKRYPHGCSDVHLDDLFMWNLWPIFMKICSQNEVNSVTQGTAASLMFTHVQSTLKSLWDQLSSGSITVGVIRKLQAKQSQLNKLIDSCSKDLGLNFVVFEQRLQELDAYQTHLKGVHLFCSSFSIPVQGMEDLKRDLNQEVNNIEIKMLCYYSPDEKRYIYPCFQSLSALSPVLPDFSSLIKNKIFTHVWKRCVSAVQDDNTKLSISAICEIVWPRVIEDLGLLKKELLQKSLQLSDVDKYFSDLRYVSDISDALESIWKWHSTFVNDQESVTCPTDCINSISNYWFMRDCEQAAEAVLTLRQELTQEGNFSEYEEIAYNVKSTMNNKTLQAITDQHQAMKPFAELFCGQRRQYLQALVKSIDVIKWLKKETKDLADLQAFVNLTLATSAGEGDLNNDRLSTLSIVGNGYQSLIYDQPKDVQFDGLAKYYSVLWEAPKINPKLPRLLIDCNESLGLYRFVKESHGQDGQTCYGQLKMIQNCGRYIIRIPSKNSSADIIKVYIDPRKKFMTVDELMDLESKLILIQRKADNSAVLEQFFDTLRAARCVADLLLAMKQVGNTQYAKCSVVFPCNLDVVAALQRLTKDMECKLQEGKTEIETCRQQFYNLNYYTTRQLLMLIKEFGIIRSGAAHSICPQVLVLLQSISTSVTSEIVMKAIHKYFSQNRKKTAQYKYIPQDILPSHSSDDTKIHPVKQEPVLSSKQKELYQMLTSQLGYDSKLALVAVDKYSDTHDAMNFCNEMSTEEESKLVDVAVQHQEPLHINVPVDDFNTSSENTKQLVSEPELSVSSISDEESLTPIQQLCKCGYTLEHATKAIEIYGDNMEEVMQYLFKTEILSPESDDIDDFELLRHCTELKINDSHVEDALTFAELGGILSYIPNGCSIQRNVPSKQLKFGVPVLLIVKPENVLKTVLSLYMEDYTKPLPTHEEVLVCNENTSEEEVTLLWRRAVGDPEFGRIFCLVHAEKLAYKVCDDVLKSLDRHTQGKRGYRLIIVCCEDSFERSHFVSKLHLYHQQYMSLSSESKYADYLMQHFKQQDMMSAASVDCDKSCVRIVTSERPGMGKSLFVKRMASKLSRHLNTNEPCHIIIPIFGPNVSPDKIIQVLCNTETRPSNAIIIHFDIAPKITWKVDTLLFSLLILKVLCDSQGNMWRSHHRQLVVVEVTLPLDPDAQSFAMCTHSFLKLLPSIHFWSPNAAAEKLLLKNENEEGSNCHLMDETKLFSPTFQMVYRYLDEYAKNNDMDSFTFDMKDLEKDKLKCLQTILRSCSIPDPSWSEVRNFVKFLQIQLRSCETSPFCNTMELKGLKSFAVKFMIIMSRDFATPSLNTMANEESSSTNALEKYQIRKHWEQQLHPYLFFNRDQASLTYIGFNISQNGDLITSTNHILVEKSVISTQLLEDLKCNFCYFQESFTSMQKHDLLEKIGTVMGLQWLHDPDESYVLTADNTIKMLAIYMRFRCGIPVVLMGETGCGKTHLIQYMCDLMLLGSGWDREKAKNLFILKVHGGTTEDDIIKVVNEAQLQATKNSEQQLDTVLFFDEANTTEAIGLIKEIMCDHRVNGKHIDTCLKFIAACNPYKRHSKQMLKKLEEAGLGYYIKTASSQERLGNIPLRQLVYRVMDLPPSIRPFVYDFGQISSKNEQDYIRNLIQHHHVCKGFTKDKIASISEVIVWSQQFMKKQKDECSFVSLRDVERAMIVFGFFMEIIPKFREWAEKIAKTNAKEKQDKETCALILTLSVCYHAKLKERGAFEDEVVRHFTSPLSIIQSKAEFLNVIQWYQDLLLDAMVIGPSAFIAKNQALRENVFMMAVCIELRIPLFLIGKPGSSKSLAKAIIASSMQGKASKHPLLQHFKQVHMFSYQCSQLSTTQSIHDIFETALCFQQNQNTAAFVSVVVLDEIGLAEDSPQLPLKVLHPLLEDGTGSTIKTCTQQNRVAFIGISNWALDPAKMNRGIMVTRGEPNITELQFSAKGICSNKDDDSVTGKLQVLFEPLAAAYQAIAREKGEKKDFFGLRDFYSLIKMLYWNCSRSKDQELTWSILLHAIKRNFGGLHGCDPVTIFAGIILSYSTCLSSDLINDIGKTSSCNPTELELIKSSLKNHDISWHGENRYLLFITENYAALQIIRSHLQNVIELSNNYAKESERTKAFVLFGSSFPKDKMYTQVCRNINQIKICMETGRPVILLNLEHLYESLYDVLNQHYTYHGENRYVDLGLQTHRVKCRVHNDFKLILIAEKSAVYDRFPTPLINRLEKHFVPITTIFAPWQHAVVQKLQAWVSTFSSIASTGYKFTNKDAFIGYQDETPATVVFHATQQVKQLRADMLEGRKLSNYNIHPSFKSHECESSCNTEEHWGEMVLHQSKWLLLQTASPSALIRLRKSDFPKEEYIELNEMYFKKQFHFSLLDLLLDLLLEPSNSQMLQVTTHSHLLTTSEVKELNTGLNLDVFCYELQEFDTEIDFCSTISTVFAKRESRKEALLIIQCESGHMCSDLIACARHKVYDELERAQRMSTTSTNNITHVLFIIKMPPNLNHHSAFIGFQSDHWISLHLDELWPSDLNIYDIHAISECKLSDVFIGPKLHHSTERTTSSQCQRLHFCIHAAVSQIPNSDRAIDCVSKLLDLIPKVSFPQTDSDSFYSVLVGHIYRILQERETVIASDWILDEASNVQGLQHGGTFQNALIRKIDEVVVPIFAEIIWWCDHMCNLDLIHESGSKNTAVRRFWLSMFKNPRIMSIKYHDVGITRNHLALERNYKCKFPFSWIIKESVDTVWSHVLCGKESDIKTIYTRVDKLLKETPIGEALEVISEIDCDELFQYYLHDFTRSVHRSHHSKLSFSDEEYKHISNALSALCNSTESFGNLAAKIALLQTMHWFYKAHIMCFAQLSWQLPDILKRDHKPSSDEMVLHLQGANAALKYLPPPFEQSEQEMQQWLLRMQYSQSAIYSALSLPSLPSNSMLEELRETRNLWQKHLVAKLFVEHITLFHKDTMKYLQRIRMILNHNKKMDFSKGKTIEDILKVLKSIPRTERDQQKGLAQRCNNFLVELVSTLCFSYWSTPDDKLAEILIQTVFDVDSSSEENQDLQQVTYNIPVTNIVLLHLLLQNRAEEIRGQLRNYCKKNKLTLVKHWSLCLLIVQCIEDALNKEWSLHMREAALIQQWSEASKYICQQTTDTDEIKEYLDNIAVLRFVLGKAAESVYNSISSSSHITSALLDKIKDICTAASPEKTESYVLYLIKVIVRRYGLSSLKRITRIYSWIVPDDVVKENCVTLLDPFVIYGAAYFSACESVQGVFHGENATSLLSMMENCTVIFMLAIYSNLFNQQTVKNAPSQNIAIIESIVEQCLPLNDKCRNTVQSFLDSQKCGGLRQLTMICQKSTTEMDLINVVVHAVTVISATNPLSIMAPLFHMLTNPCSLQDKYLPTMPDDFAMQSYKALSGQFYHCSKGHPYLVSECGHQCHMTCPTCGVPIGDSIPGGKSTVTIKKISEFWYVWSHTRVQIFLCAPTNSTKTGYVLGYPHERSSTPAPKEGGLTPASCCIIRALMHSLLLWTSCNNKAGLLQLIPFQEDQIPDFLCSHLEKDVYHLGKAIGRSCDEALIVIHLVLQDILDRKLASVSSTEPQNSLATRDARDAWEVQFQSNYILPTLQAMNTKIHSVIHLNLIHKKQGFNNRLLSIAYESKQSEESNIEHLLWAFRPKITLENIMQMIETTNLRSSCPILHSFINQETNLRATQYLPDIVHLQQYFYERYTSQIQRKTITGKTVGHFLKDSGGDRERLGKMISSLSKAWKLVHDKLPDHAFGRLQLNTKYLVSDITDDTDLECLIPMTTGYGVCTTVLVDLLVCTHNDFIEKCRVANNSKWRPQRIPISHLDACHLISYEHQLVPVLISYCQYLNFMDTERQQIQLNLAALEKRIMDQFVLGKPYIMFDVPLVVFKRDLTSTLRKKIIQEEVTEQDRANLCSTLRTPNQLKSTLDEISILLGFLSSMGGSGETCIRDYAAKTLKMKPPAVSEFLKLKHIVSIWQALSVQLAIATDQEPFDQLQKEFLSDLKQSQKEELDIVLRRFNLNNLLGILYELVESHLRFSSQEELSMPLVQTVKGFLEVCGARPIPEFDEFPDSITFKQIVATWKHIALYKKSHEHDKQASS